jgi:hypothetical protein
MHRGLAEADRNDSPELTKPQVTVFEFCPARETKSPLRRGFLFGRSRLLQARDPPETLGEGISTRTLWLGRLVGTGTDNAPKR